MSPRSRICESEPAALRGPRRSSATPLARGRGARPRPVPPARTVPSSCSALRRLAGGGGRGRCCWLVTLDRDRGSRTVWAAGHSWERGTSTRVPSAGVGRCADAHGARAHVPRDGQAMVLPCDGSGGLKGGPGGSGSKGPGGMRAPRSADPQDGSVRRPKAPTPIVSDLTCRGGRPA